MQKILVGGAGGAASEGVIQSLLCYPDDLAIVAMGSDKSDLVLSQAEKRYLVPKSHEPSYIQSVNAIVAKESPNFLHVQHDREVLEVSLLRSHFDKLGVKTFLPSHETVQTCVDKWKTFLEFKKAGIVVPENILINDKRDLKRAFKLLADKEGKIWIRSNEIAGGGRGALPTNSFDFALNWIMHHNGWSRFLAAQNLTSETVTWLSIWYEGKLVVGQGRKRSGWIHSNRTLSGVTGVTKVGITCNDEEVTRVAIRAIQAVDEKPHGVYGVDMAYDQMGVPNPTEINIGRFFTTILFFTQAGLNFPKIYTDLGISGKTDYQGKAINPLEEELFWFRGVDSSPKLMRRAEIESRYQLP